jgi:glycerophosphoryl diester phosphodiesterase
MKHPFSIQGHRGARGHFPENTIQGFLQAIAMGVNGIEMDVVISKDKQVVVSHEPWMNELFCLDPEGMPVEKNTRGQYNLYHMTYAEIASFDCGVNGNPNFPEQKKVSAVKPLLRDVIRSVEAFLQKDQLPGITYNIEIKSEPELYQDFQPEPAEFVALVMAEIKQHKLKGDFYISSFDPAILQVVHQKHPDVQIGLLVENSAALHENLKTLGFKPGIYSPYFQLINEELIAELHAQQIRLNTWTVNNTEDMKKLVELGVDGIITDYPDRLVKLIKTTGHLDKLV